MESLYLLIPLSIVLVFVIGALFWWATQSGQFDDLEGPGHRVLMDNDDCLTPENRDEGDDGDSGGDAGGDSD